MRGHASQAREPWILCDDQLGESALQVGDELGVRFKILFAEPRHVGARLSRVHPRAIERRRSQPPVPTIRVGCAASAWAPLETSAIHVARVDTQCRALGSRIWPVCMCSRAGSIAGC